MAKPKPIKVCLTNQGVDTETPWAEDLGPAPGHPAGSRKVRLINVPFRHAKPTWGDTVVVTPIEQGFPTWDRGGVPWAEIGTRIADDGGRWAMIVDYAPHPDAANAFDALVRACAEHEVVCEGAWAPCASTDAGGDGVAGRAYLAVRVELSDVELMRHLRAAALPCELVQVHPTPAVEPCALKKQAAKQPAPAAESRPVQKPAGKPAAPAIEPRRVQKPAGKQVAAVPSKRPAVNKPPAIGKQAASAPSKRPAVNKPPAAGTQAAESKRPAVLKPPAAGKQAAPSKRAAA